MEAIAIQVNQSGTETKNSEVQKPETQKSSGNFFSLLKNLTSAIERERTLVPNKNKAVPSEFLQTGDEYAKKLQDDEKSSKSKKVLSKNKKEQKTSVDLKLNFDEEINPRKLLADLANEKAGLQLPRVALKQASVRQGEPRSENVQSLTDSDAPKTLLQILMHGDINKLSDDELNRLLANAEKMDKDESKSRFSLAGLKKQTENDADTGSHSGENNAKQAEMKKITVEDFRTSKNMTHAVKASQEEAVTTEIGTHGTNGERVATEAETHVQTEFTINIVPEKSAELSAKPESMQQNGKPAESVNFSQALAEQLYRANEDIVQAGKVILRNSNEGTIRLNLQPAHLGKVNILLEMRDGKKLSGKISVQSKEALSAFEENLGELIESFKENGFELSGFELSWSGNGENGERFANNERKLFGFSQSYEEDLALRSNENFAEKVIGFGETKAVNVLA